MREFVQVITILCQVLIGIIIVRAILSWFNISRDNPLIIILNFISDPILDPLRRIIPRIDGLDLTPMIAILILWLIYWLLTFLVL